MKQTKITYEAFGDTLLIHMPKELDHHNCRDLKRDTDLMLDENYINRIIFDFGKTEFMDSSGIGVLLNRYKQMAASRGTVTYYGAPVPMPSQSIIWAAAALQNCWTASFFSSG